MSKNKSEKENTKSEWVRTPPLERNTITRPELIKMVSEKLGGRYPRDEIYWIVQATFRCFPDILKAGYTLTVGDCFTLKPKLRKRRTYKSPGGKIAEFEDHYIPCFKPRKKLKDACLSLPVNEEINNEEDSDDED